MRVKDKNQTFDAEATLKENVSTDDRFSEAEYDSRGAAIEGRGFRKRKHEESSNVIRSRKPARPTFLSGL